MPSQDLYSDGPAKDLAQRGHGGVAVPEHDPLASTILKAAHDLAVEQKLAAPESPRQVRKRMHAQRCADDQKQVRLGLVRAPLLSDVLRNVLAEEHHIGLDQASAIPATRHAAGQRM